MELIPCPLDYNVLNSSLSIVLVGDVDFEEFLAWWQNVRQERGGSIWASSINMRNRELQEKEDLHELFQLIDTDNSDAIDADELGKMTSDLGLSLTTVELELVRSVQYES